MSPTPQNLAGLERGELERTFAALDIPAFHARQVFHWVHARGVTDFARMTNLGQALRERLQQTFTIESPIVEQRQVSTDGTTKFLLRLGDGRHIETVYIPDTPAQTFCISTQAGCGMGCGFCLTATMGLGRNLTAAEIAGQARVAAHETGLAGKPFNVVLMGMGEPLHNYDATMKALRILADEQGLAVHPRRVTLSTVGIVPGLERLAGESLLPNVAVSLHATTDAQRDTLVPINRKYPIATLLAACRKLPLGRQRRLTFEYVLLAGVNDTDADARRLVKLMSGLKAKVNLLPLNEAPAIPFARPSDERVNAFARILAEKDVTVLVRRSRGRDIRAACGQLAVEGERRSPAQQLAAQLTTDN